MASGMPFRSLTSPREVLTGTRAQYCREAWRTTRGSGDSCRKAVCRARIPMPR